MFTQSSLTRFIIALTIFASAFASQAFAAKSCARYKEQIKHYEDLRRAGGSMAKMNRWTARGHELEDALRKCTKENGGAIIQIASGDQTKPAKSRSKAERKPLRKSSSDDEQLTRLIQTCNYWIAQSNDTSSQDNINFREIACNAVDNYQAELKSPAPPPDNTIAVRKLKECIKPNNLIDAEVNECIKGTTEPTWRK